MRIWSKYRQSTKALLWCAGLTKSYVSYWEPRNRNQSINSARVEPQEKNMTDKIIVVYQYKNLGGEVIHETVRYDPKSFRQRRPDGHGGYIYNLNGIEPVLYRLPEITEAIVQGTPIILVEGEKDADNLVKLGFEATTAPMGAGTPWRDSYTETLKGAQVVIIPDNDPSGWKHAIDVADALYFTCECVKIVRLPGHGKDISDWISAGGIADQLKSLIDDAPIYMPLDLQRAWHRVYKIYTPNQLNEELERLKIAPRKYTPRRELVEQQLIFCKKALEYKSYRHKYYATL